MKIPVSLCHNLQFEDREVSGFITKRCFTNSEDLMLAGTSAFKGKQNIPIDEFEFNPKYEIQSDGRYNTRVRYEGAPPLNSKEPSLVDVYCRLSRLQKFKLNWMFDEHWLQHIETKKWLVTIFVAACGVAATVYTKWNSDNRVDKLKEDNIRLEKNVISKDSLNRILQKSVHEKDSIINAQHQSPKLIE